MGAWWNTLIRAVATRLAPLRAPRQHALYDEVNVLSAVYDALFAFRSIYTLEVDTVTGRLLRVSPSLMALTGYSREELVGMPIKQLTAEEDRPIATAAHEEAMRTKTYTHTTEKRYLCKDGSKRWVCLDASVVRSAAGRPLSALGVAFDITERKETEKALQASEKQFRSLVENLPGLAWSAQADGSLDFYSQRWSTYTGATPADLLRWTWQAWVEPSMLAAARAKWQESIRSGEPFEMELQLRAADGGYRWFFTRATALRDDHGGIVRWFGVNTDVDVQRRAQVEREKLVAQLHQALQMQDDFLAVAAHELRTPLTALSLDAERLLRFVKQGAIDTRCLPEKVAHVHGHVQRLKTLVEGLLDTVRLESDKLAAENSKALPPSQARQ